MLFTNHRYILRRFWNLQQYGRINWIMLNPSTADDTFDDATIRKLRMRLAIIFAALLLVSCAPHLAVQAPTPMPAPDPPVACTPVWIPLKSADMYYAYDWACIGGNAIGGVYLVSFDPDLFTSKAWNASLHDWVTVATKQPLAIAQKAVTDYLANPPHASLWRRLRGCWGEFGDCRGWLIFGWAYPLWIFFGGQ
jgi:hypothetical protein